MQKIKGFFPFLFLSSFYLQAAPETAASAPPADADADATPVALSAGQEQLVSALQDDILFERQKRQLSNELALEKLRAELQKVRADSAPALTMPVAPPQVAKPQPDAPPPPAAPPRVVLVSQVAGISRVGVSVNGQLRFIGRNETFPANGKTYRLVAGKNSLLVAREVE